MVTLKYVNSFNLEGEKSRQPLDNRNNVIRRRVCNNFYLMVGYWCRLISQGIKHLHILYSRSNILVVMCNCNNQGYINYFHDNLKYPHCCYMVKKKGVIIEINHHVICFSTKFNGVCFFLSTCFVFVKTFIYLYHGRKLS